MGPEKHPGLHAAAILNAAWLVRHYVRGGRSSIQRQQRREAIGALGAAVRDALATCYSAEDYEAILAAVVDGLRPNDDPPF
jgi:hypothetical protein